MYLNTLNILTNDAFNKKTQCLCTLLKSLVKCYHWINMVFLLYMYMYHCIIKSKIALVKWDDVLHFQKIMCAMWWSYYEAYMRIRSKHNIECWKNMTSCKYSVTCFVNPIDYRLCILDQYLYIVNYSKQNIAIILHTIELTFIFAYFSLSKYLQMYIKHIHTSLNCPLCLF